MKNLLIATSIFAAGLGAVAVHAQSTDTPQAPTAWMPISVLVTKLETQGYQVLEIEREDGMAYEVEMLDGNGFKVEAYLDAVTGEPVRYVDSDDDDRDGRSEVSDSDD